MKTLKPKHLKISGTYDILKLLDNFTGYALLLLCIVALLFFTLRPIVNKPSPEIGKTVHISLQEINQPAPEFRSIYRK